MSKFDLGRHAFSGVNANAVYLDKECTILAMNDAWIEFGRQNGACDPDGWIGKSYFAAFDFDKRDPGIIPIIDGITRVADGIDLRFVYDYPCHSPDAERWYRLIAQRVGNDRQVLVAHVDRTQTVSSEQMVALSKTIIRRSDWDMSPSG